MQVRDAQILMTKLGKILFVIVVVILGIAAIILALSLNTDRETTVESPTEGGAENVQQEILQKEPIKYTGTIKTLSDFAISPFCQNYTCRKEDSWSLRSGSVNHSYRIPLGGDSYNYITIEIVVLNDQIKSFGVMYFDREVSGLREGDVEIVYNLLSSIEANESIEPVKDYIVRNIEREIAQIKQAAPIIWGTFNVYAGKVGQQTISIESRWN